MCSLDLLRVAPVGEEVHREHHVFEHCREVEKCAVLKQDADFLMQRLLFAIVHCREGLVSVLYVSAVRRNEADEILQQHGLS